MSVLERRLQILIDHARYERLEDEARRSGRSVASIVRDAIDLQLGAEDAARSAAARRLLALDPVPSDDWSVTKTALEHDVARRVP